MATIKKLMVAIAADSSKIVSELNKIDGSLERFAKTADSLGEKLNASLGKGAQGGETFQASLKKNREELVNFAKDAEVTGREVRGVFTEAAREGNNVARALTQGNKGLNDFAKMADKAAKRTKLINDHLAKAARTAKVAALAIAGAASAVAVGVVAMVERQSEKLDALAKKADKLGLGVAALQKLEYQAELTGVSQDTLGTALQRMTRRVAEAASGTGEAKNAIAELGLSAQQLAGMSPDKQFYAIAEAMKGVSNQGDRIKLAMKVFDSEGVGLVNTFAADLKGLGKQFDGLGISMTRPALAAVEAYNDAKTNIGWVFDGLKNHITAGVVPAMEVLVSKTLEFIKEAGGIEQVAQNMTTWVLTGIQKMVQGMQTLVEAINWVKEAYNTVVGTGQVAGGIVSKGVASVAGSGPLSMLPGMDTLAKNADMLGDSFYSVAQDTAAARVEMLRNAQQYSDRMKKLVDSVGEAKQSVIAGFSKEGGAAQESAEVTQWRNEIATLQQQIMDSPGQNIAPVLAEINALKEKIATSTDPMVGSNDKNTTATEENTRALNAAALAQKGAAGGAWEKIFGKPKDEKKQGDKVDANFSRAAQEYKNAIANGATGSAEAAAKRMKEILESYQKNPFGHSAASSNMGGKWGFSTGRADEYDVGGMQAVLEKLLSGEGAPNMGSITVNVKKEDGGEVSGNVTGEQAFLQQLANIMSNVSTAV